MTTDIGDSYRPNEIFLSTISLPINKQINININVHLFYSKVIINVKLQQTILP